MNCKNTQIVTIKKVVNGGFGLAAGSDGKTILVEGALPGEVATVSVTKQYRHYDRAVVEAIISAHPERMSPPCPFYGRCGGCNLQHVAYPAQCRIKKAIVTDLFARSSTAAVQQRAGSIAPTIGCSRPFGYRQRIRLQVDPAGRIGFYRHQSHEVIPIDRCLLAAPLINHNLLPVPTLPAFIGLARQSTAVEFLLDPGDASLYLRFLLKRSVRPADRAGATALCRKIDHPVRVLLTGANGNDTGPLTADDRPADRCLSMELPGNPPLQVRWEAGGFSQVNYEQNRVLVSRAVTLADAAETDQVLDLFCGMGNFSLPLAQRCGAVLGIENQGLAIRHARQNSADNTLINATFKKDDVASACRRLANRGRRFDIVICDPPRQGMPGLAPLLARLCRRRLVYISCDPATLCRDCSALSDAGFTLVSCQPIDMFPQTHHIETLALLEKN